MTIKLGINGFGRIGRLALRAALKHGYTDIQIVGINDPKPSDYLAYMLKYDSVHGRFDGTVDSPEDSLIVNGKKIKLSHERDAHNLRWGEMGVHTVLECTGHYLTEPTSQMTVDGSSRKDWRGGRGILENIIPSSTGAAKAVGKVIPELNKKITGMAFRVPTSDVSVVDLTIELENEASYDEICAEMKAQSEGALKGVLGYTDEKVVSTDFRGEPCASVFDATAGLALDKNFVKIVAWYDNEWGYAKQCLEMVRVVAKKK